MVALRRLAGLAVCAACGRYGFDPPFGVTPFSDATLGDTADAPAGATRCAWDPVPAFNTVEPLTIINTSGYDADPTLSRDQLTLYYVDGAGPHMSRRATPHGAFGPREEIPTMQPFGSDNGVFIAANNLDGFVSVLASTSNYDIYSLSRATQTSPFDAPVPVTELDSPFNEFNARLSLDEQTLLFLQWSAPTDPTTARLHLAHRQGSSWVNIEQVFPTSTATEESGSFVGDSLHIVYASDGDLYVASRASEADPFGSPVLITGPGIGISTTYSEEIPFVSADGCELLFLSVRPGGAGGNDIYHAIAVP